MKFSFIQLSMLVVSCVWWIVSIVTYESQAKKRVVVRVRYAPD